MTKTFLELERLNVSVAGQQVVSDLSLKIAAGELHVLMGPNGSGKSSLAAALAGHPAYTASAADGSRSPMKWRNGDLADLSPDERAQQGLFLAFQQPLEVPGVRLTQLLRTAHAARFGTESQREFPTALAFKHHLQKLCAQVGLSTSLLDRGVNEGASGGERKRLELVQLMCLRPDLAILDELDSGLDIDALRLVATTIQKAQADWALGLLVITHYERLLKVLRPSHVHIMVAGRIVESGGPELAQHISKQGYQQWLSPNK